VVPIMCRRPLLSLAVRRTQRQLAPAPTKPRSVRVNAMRGVAALSVAVYHVLLQARAHEALAFGLPALDGVISRNLDRLGGWGVSIFLVLSGFGLVQSFQRSESLRRFAPRRAAPRASILCSGGWPLLQSY